MPTLLVIDDDPVVAEMIRSLMPAAWTVLAALDGLAGLDIVRQRATGDCPLDLVILDIDLPGMDGFDTCVLLRAVAPQLPIIPFTHLRNDQRVPRYMTEFSCAPPIYKGVAPHVVQQSIQAAFCQVPPMPAQSPTAVFERLLEKAVEAETRARTARAVRVGLFATDMIGRLGLHQMLAMVEGIAVIAVESDRCVAAQVFQQGRVTMLMAPAADYQMVRILSRTLNVPALFLARTLKDARTITPLIPEQRDGPALGLVIIDEAFAQACAAAFSTLIQGIPSVDPRVHDMVQQLLDAVVAAHVFDGLSLRLIEVLILDLFGLSATEICDRLYITPGSLKTYRRRIAQQCELDHAALHNWACERIAGHPRLWEVFCRLRGDS